MSRASSSFGSSASSSRRLASIARSRRRSAAGYGGGLARPQVGEDVRHRLADRLRIDAVLGVVRLLQPAPAVRLAERPLHRVRHLIGVHDHLTLDVAGRPADRLDERRLAAQEAFLVGIEDGHQRHLGQVEALPQAG